jgi:hypothetical protein
LDYVTEEFSNTGAGGGKPADTHRITAAPWQASTPNAQAAGPPVLACSASDVHVEQRELTSGILHSITIRYFCRTRRRPDGPPEDAADFPASSA